MKKDSDFIKRINISKKNDMDYFVDISTSRSKRKFIERIKRVVRSSKEYRDYIQYLKENVGLDQCIFWSNIIGGRKKRVTLEMHHEPFTLDDYVRVILKKYEVEGMELNDLEIADEVMEIHYENLVGLVPVSKTAHQLIGNTDKLFVPLNMVYGNYTEFMKRYDKYIEALDKEEDYDLYSKLEKKIDQTKNLTNDSFDAIKKQFTYLDVEDREDVAKMRNIEESMLA